MKIKSDFVTNSSSTSFIITCKTEAGEKDEFIDKFNRLLHKYVKERGWDDDFQEPPILTNDMVNQIASGEFTIMDFVPIYYDEKSIPQYIRELFLTQDSEVAELLNESGIKLVNVDVKDLNVE